MRTYNQRSADTRVRGVSAGVRVSDFKYSHVRDPKILDVRVRDLKVFDVRVRVRRSLISIRCSGCSDCSGCSNDPSYSACSVFEQFEQYTLFGLFGVLTVHAVRHFL